MPLHRSARTHEKNLYEMYTWCSQLQPASRWKTVGTMMLDLLPRLEEICAPIDVWPAISHWMLGLKARDGYPTQVYVTIEAMSWNAYRVRYLIPEDESPWPDAYVEAYARTLDEACDLIRIAIRNSRGWQYR